MRLQPFFVPQGPDPVCLFDVDDVVAHLSQLLRPALNIATQQRRPLQEWTSYDLSTLYPLDRDAIMDLICQQRLLERAAPIPATVSWIRHLHAQGAQIHFATARGFHPQAHALTEDWMKRHAVPFHSVTVTQAHESKIEACKHLGRIAMMVEDHDAHLDAAEASGQVDRLVLVDSPWNRHRKDFRYSDAHARKLRVCALTRGSRDHPTGAGRYPIRQASPA